MKEYRALVACVVVFFFLVLFLVLCSPVRGECVPNQDIQVLIDIGGGPKLTLICETNSKTEAYQTLEEYQNIHKLNNCWVGKEQGEELYRIFCPYIEGKRQ